MACDRAVLLCLAPLSALAHGSVPEAGGVLLPQESSEVTVVGDLGLFFSDDGGSTYAFVCAEAVDPFAGRYALAGDRLYAMAGGALVASADRFCSRTRPDALSDLYVADVAPAPGGRLLLVAAAGKGAGPMSLWESTDSLETLGGPLYSAPADGTMVSAMAAPSDPRVLYATVARSFPALVLIARSDDGGSTWQEHDATSALGPSLPMLLAVDPEDPRRVYLRVATGGNDALAFSADGGARWSAIHTVFGAIAAFLLRADRTLWVSSALGTVWRAEGPDGPFEIVPGAPHARAFGERAGVLYAVGDVFLDGFMLSTSADGGATWVPGLALDRRVCGLPACAAVRAACGATWDDWETRTGFPRPACGSGATGPVPVPSGGPPPRPGCGCGGGAGGVWLAPALLVVLALRHLRAGRARRSPPSRPARSVPSGVVDRFRPGAP